MINPINAPELTASIQRDYLKEAKAARVQFKEAKQKISTSNVFQALKALLVRLSFRHVL